MKDFMTWWIMCVLMVIILAEAASGIIQQIMITPMINKIRAYRFKKNVVMKINKKK